MTAVAPLQDPVLLPFRHLHWRSTVVALLAAAAPACGVTLWLSTQDGDPVPAVALTVLVAVAAAALSGLIMRIRLVLEADGLRQWSLHRRGHRIPRSTVSRAVVRAVHAPDGLHANRHLFLLDPAGRTLFRMCDRWWTEHQVGRVARHFAVPLESLPEAVQLSELRRVVPDQLRWDERHPVITRMLIALGGFAGCLVVAALAVASL